MGVRIIELRTCDICGKEQGPDEGQTVKFSWNNKNYEIDLCQKDADKMSNSINTYAEAARRLATSGKAYRNVATGPDPRAVRAWAKTKGIEVSDRGRVPAELVTQFIEAGV